MQELLLSPMMKLESRTSRANFDKGSMSFYCEFNALQVLAHYKEVLLVHTCKDSGSDCRMIVSGVDFLSRLEKRTYKGKTFFVYRHGSENDITI